MFYFDEDVQNYDESDEERLTRHDSNFSADSEESRSRYMGRDTDRFFGDYDDDIEDDDCSEATEDPSELVSLGQRGGGRSPRTGKKRNTGFDDFYRLTDDHLGSGAYASVNTCVSKTTGKEYAVKMVDKQTESHTRSRLLREVRTFNICRDQPNIVQLVQWFEDDEHFFMVFEKMRGGPLLKHILRKGYFTEEEARMVTKDIASALKFLHDRGIAHRDVKPENVLCTDPDRVSPVKLCDLDLASRPPGRYSSPTMTRVASEPDLASPVGSAEFMAPEVVDAFVGDALKYDKRCDMWSLGVILYIMLCGYAPFQGECSDPNCGWMDGQPCDDCQQDLFQRIQCGQYEFNDDEWAMISDDAKDLVSNLLLKDVSRRFTAADVLAHPWVVESAPRTMLSTPSNLFRNDSARDVQQMSENFNVMSRLVAVRLSTCAPDAPLEHSQVSGPISVSENSSTDSQGTPTDPPPSSIYDNYDKSLPFFMRPPSAFFDEMSGQMVYPPGQGPPVTISPQTGSFFSSLGQHVNDVSAQPIISRAIARESRRFQSSSETCGEAMAKQDSMSDVHQMARETEVNV